MPRQPPKPDIHTGVKAQFLYHIINLERLQFLCRPATTADGRDAKTKLVRRKLTKEEAEKFIEFIESNSADMKNLVKMIPVGLSQNWVNEERRKRKMPLLGAEDAENVAVVDNSKVNFEEDKNW